jgi:hypothetical protein
MPSGVPRNCSGTLI